MTIALLTIVAFIVIDSQLLYSKNAIANKCIVLHALINFIFVLCPRFLEYRYLTEAKYDAINGTLIDEGPDPKSLDLLYKIYEDSEKHKQFRITDYGFKPGFFTPVAGADLSARHQMSFFDNGWAVELEHDSGGHHYYIKIYRGVTENGIRDVFPFILEADEFDQKLMEEWNSALWNTDEKFICKLLENVKNQEPFDYKEWQRRRQESENSNER